MPDWTDERIRLSLAAEGELIPAAAAHSQLPRLPGFYSIFVDTPDSLPEPFASFLRENNTNLIYIGVAKKSLLKRLVRQDLCGGTSTFFRGIGAVRGFWPVPGHLFGKANQNNFRFSRDDNARIIAWNLAHLYVRFVAVDTSLFPNAEANAIRGHCPILNKTHNPNPVKDLVDIRAECRRIARNPQ